MEIKRGDVVLVVLSGDLGKPRPAVVVQSDALGERLTIIVCPMSSEIDGAELIRPVLQPSAANGLHVASQIMTDKIMSVRRPRVRRVLGRVDAETQSRIDQALLIVVGLTG